MTVPGSVTSIGYEAFSELKTMLLLGDDWPECEEVGYYSSIDVDTVYTSISKEIPTGSAWEDFNIVRLQEVIEMLPCEPAVYHGEKPNLPLMHSIPGYRVTAYGDSIHAGEYEQTEVELWFTIEGCQDSVAGTFTLSASPYTYTIQKKSLVATTEEPSYSIHYGDELPIVKLAYQGLVPGDDETAIATPPAITCESGDRPPCRYAQTNPVGWRSAGLRVCI